MSMLTYATTTKAPSSVNLRWDTDATSGIPADVYDPAGNKLDQVYTQHAASPSGRIPTVQGTAGTVYVRQVDYRGNPLPGVIVAITGVGAVPDPTPGGAVTKAVVLATGVQATDIGGTTPSAAHADAAAQIAALINSAPGALDTLKELADAMGDDPNFAATVTNALANKAPLASPALTGSPTVNGNPITGGGSAPVDNGLGGISA